MDSTALTYVIGSKSSGWRNNRMMELEIDSPYQQHCLKLRNDQRAGSIEKKIDRFLAKMGVTQVGPEDLREFNTSKRGSLLTIPSLQKRDSVSDSFDHSRRSSFSGLNLEGSSLYQRRKTSTNPIVGSLPTITS